MMTEQFAVTGMTCAACSAHVEKAVSRLSGVQSAPVNLMLGSMTVTYDEKAVAEGDIIAAVKAAGYGASPASQTDQGQLRRDQDAALRRRKKHLIWSVVFLVPLFYLSMGHMMGLPLPQVLHTHPLLLACLQLALVIPILILNRNYFTVGFSRLVKLSPNMDSLVAVGAAAGLVYSLIEMGLLAAGQVSGMPDLYFESAGMILTLVAGIRLPHILEQTIQSVSAIASPLQLFLLGAFFQFSGLKTYRRELVTVSIAKLIVSPGLFLGLGALLGFRGVAFVSLIGIFASPTAVNSFTMAQQMGGDAELAGDIVVTTSAASILTMFLWIFLFKSLGMF
mgnify:CR=1 FL=1